MMAFDCAHEKKHGVKDPGAMNIERERGCTYLSTNDWRAQGWRAVLMHEQSVHLLFLFLFFFFCFFVFCFASF